MATDILRRIILFIVLCLVQGLVLNHINLLGCATPLLYVYMALTFPRGYPRWAELLWCFFLGLSVDTFTNTPGVAAASMTLVGVLQPYILETSSPRFLTWVICLTSTTCCCCCSSTVSLTTRSRCSRSSTGWNGRNAWWEAC